MKACGGSKRVAPPIINLNTRRRWVGDQLHSRSAYTPRETVPVTYWTGGWVSPETIRLVLRRDKFLGSTGIRTTIAPKPKP